jgi:hypothetical protein
VTTQRSDLARTTLAGLEATRRRHDGTGPGLGVAPAVNMPTARGGAVSADDQDQIEHMAIDLIRELGDEVGPETIRQEVTRVYDSFTAARIRQYVPVLTRRIVREQLIRSRPRSVPPRGGIP